MTVIQEILNNPTIPQALRLAAATIIDRRKKSCYRDNRARLSLMHCEYLKRLETDKTTPEEIWNRAQERAAYAVELRKIIDRQLVSDDYDFRAALEEIDSVLDDRDAYARIAKTKAVRLGMSLETPAKASGPLSLAKSTATTAAQPTKPIVVKERINMHSTITAPRNKQTREASSIHTVNERYLQDPKRGFNTPQEFFKAIFDTSRSGKITDERLKSLAAGSDEHGIYTNPNGGFLVPEGFLSDLDMTTWEGDPTAGMTKNVPMQVPKLSFHSRVDKNHSTSVSGGLRVYRRAETQTVASSRIVTEKINLEASELMGIGYATNELLTYSPISIAALLSEGFGDEFGSRLLQEKLRGTGVGEFLGILNSDALITVSKKSGQTAATVIYENLLAMRSRIWRRSSSVWLYNADVEPQLATMTDPSGRLIWQAGATEGSPDRLLGLPMYPTEHCSALGTVGDIVLADFSQYLVGTLTGIQSDSSVHVRFLENETAFKFWLSNAGAPWWNSVLTPKNGTTKSPFVTLETRG